MKKKQIVEHPKYGKGKIIKTTEESPPREALVRFVNGAIKWVWTYNLVDSNK